MVLSSSWLPSLWDDPAHEVELAEVKTDQDGKVKHIVVLLDVCLTCLTKVPDRLRKVLLDLHYCLAQLLIIQSMTMRSRPLCVCLVRMSLGQHLVEVRVDVFFVPSAVRTADQLVRLPEVS